MDFFTIFFCTALLMANSGSVASKEFCQAFQENGNKIDYIYSPGFRQSVSSKDRKNTIIINNIYWNYVFNHWKKDPKVEFDSNYSQSAPLFNNTFFGAGCLWTGSKLDGSCQTLLFPKKFNGSVDVIAIPNDEHTSVRPLSEFKSLGTAKVNGLSSTDQMVYVFGPNIKDWEQSVLEFVRQKDNAFTEERFRFDSDTFGNFSAVNLTNEMNGVKGVTNQTGVLAVTSQYNDGWGGDAYGYLIIFEDNLVIRWCWRHYQKPLSDCQFSGMLANCTVDLRTTTTTPFADPPPDDTTLWVIVVIAAITVFLIISIVVLIWFLKKRSEQEETSQTNKSAMSSIPPKSTDNRFSDVMAAKKKKKKKASNMGSKTVSKNSSNKTTN